MFFISEISLFNTQIASLGMHIVMKMFLKKAMLKKKRLRNMLMIYFRIKWMKLTASIKCLILQRKNSSSPSVKFLFSKELRSLKLIFTLIKLKENSFKFKYKLFFFVSII
jgi:hypothetical protein